jgi:PKD repeat protein
MKTIITALLLATTVFLNAQNTAIPDANFEQALINLGLDSGPIDGSVLTANIDTLTTLNVNNKSIADLTGIEDFVSLTSLNCKLNFLTSLNVTQNIALDSLGCSSNPITDLDVTQNTALSILDCGLNQLDSIDITQNIALKELLCYGNNLTKIDITQNIILDSLDCRSNLLDSINISQNPNLKLLNCSWNNIDTLNLTLNLQLKHLMCSQNKIANLDVTALSNLETLICSGQFLVPSFNFDVTQNLALIKLGCGGNDITSLDVTQNVALEYLDCSANYNLSSLDVTQNTALKYLDLGLDSLTSIDLSQNPNLEQLFCYNNYLTSLDVSQNTALTLLFCAANLIDSLDVSQLSALTRLVCQGNLLTSLDISQNSNIFELICSSNNNLTCLNAKNGNNANFTNFVANFNPLLGCIEVDNPTYSNANWTSIDVGSNFSSNCYNACSVTQCIMSANYTVANNGSGNYSFTNTSTGSYSLMDWSFGDGTSSALTNPNHTFLADGNYTVVLAVADTTIQTGSSCIDYYYTTINVSGVPAPLQCNSGFVMYPDTTSNNITVVNSATGSNLTYLWNFGDGTSNSVLQNPNHTYTGTGPYYLCLTVNDGAGCIDMFCDSIGVNGVVFKQAGFSINVITNIPTEINNTSLSTDLSIYPNPTTRHITIDLSSTQTNVTATLTNSLGQVVISENYNSTNSINLNIDAPKGIYFLRLETDEEIITRKIVKE